jgi:hypothetical protein
MNYFAKVSRAAIIIIAGFPIPMANASAANVYIAQGASGSANGSSCANAYAATFFNTSTNWGSAASEIGPGTTVNLCGTITTELKAQGSGSSGSPITILFQPFAQISLPYCDDTNGCLNIDGKSYIIVDGGTACGPGTACASTAIACMGKPSACGTGSIVQTSNGAGYFPITNITCSGGVATVTGPNPFGFGLAPYPAPLPVLISGSSISSYNGSWKVVSDYDSTNTFTINAPCNGTGTGGSAGIVCPSGAYCTYWGAAILVDAQNNGCSNCEVRNLILGPTWYTTTSQSEQSNLYAGGNGAAIYAEGTSGTLKIHDSAMPYGVINYVPTASGDNGLSIYNTDIYNTNSAVNIASTSSSSILTGAQIYNNHFHDTEVTDAAGCPDHHNSLHAWGFTGGSNSNINFYNNVIDGNWGGCATGGLFFEGSTPNLTVYNNFWNMTYTQMNNGIVGLDGDGFASTVQFYNNIMIGQNIGDVCMTFGSGSTAASITMKNNILVNCSTLFAGQGSNITFTSMGNNIWGGSPASTPWGLSCSPGPCTYYNFSGWESAVKESGSSFGTSTSYAGLSSSGQPLVTSPAVNAGADLTSVGIAALDLDAAGNARPSSGAWTIGAYNSASSSGGPAAPTSLSALTQ